MGNRVFGCDDCLAVCPWNKFAADARETRMNLREELRLAPLAELAGLDDAAFRARFAGTPVKRTGRDRFVRNVLCAIGNCGDERLAPAASALLDDNSPLVRGMAAWALRRLLDEAAFERLKSARAGRESDLGVLEEWDMNPDEPEKPPEPEESPGPERPLGPGKSPEQDQPSAADADAPEAAAPLPESPKAPEAPGPEPLSPPPPEGEAEEALYQPETRTPPRPRDDAIADAEIPMPGEQRIGGRRARDARINLDLDLGRIKRRKRYGLFADHFQRAVRRAWCWRR